MTRVRAWLGWSPHAIAAALILIMLLFVRPAETAKVPRFQLGLASYYGPGFHGRETASGETFNQWQMAWPIGRSRSGASCA